MGATREPTAAAAAIEQGPEATAEEAPRKAPAKRPRSSSAVKKSAAGGEAVPPEPKAEEAPPTPSTSSAATAATPPAEAAGAVSAVSEAPGGARSGAPAKAHPLTPAAEGPPTSARSTSTGTARAAAPTTEAPTLEANAAAAAPAAATSVPTATAPSTDTPLLPDLTAAPEGERKEFRGTGRRVVVAEDEALIRLDVVETLTEAGFQVVGEAGDGERAVTLATELRPDVVVMDIKMPVLDGISAAERIGRARIAPVVLLTAFSQAELVERARDAGAMAYVVKPFTPAELLPAIEIAVARHQEITALESEVADLAERFETRKRVERAKGLLMTKMGLTEPESFRWIQKTSMDRRLTMREVADAVIEQVGSDKNR
jgi:AmiR/NasT family two-component response regulator